MKQKQQHHVMRKTRETHIIDRVFHRFICDICGREISISVRPYHKKVIVVGDDYAIHSGGIGGLELNTEEEEDDGDIA